MFDTVMLNTSGLATSCDSAAATGAARAGRGAAGRRRPPTPAPPCAATSTRARAPAAGADRARGTGDRRTRTRSGCRARRRSFSPRTLTGTIALSGSRRLAAPIQQVPQAGRARAQQDVVDRDPVPAAVRRRSASGRLARARCRPDEIGALSDFTGRAGQSWRRPARGRRAAPSRAGRAPARGDRAMRPDSTATSAAVRSARPAAPRRARADPAPATAPSRRRRPVAGRERDRG